jgi:hypothetical protein
MIMRRRFVGLKWKEVGSKKPSTGTEFNNGPLAAALQKQVEFTKEEWERFQVADLSSDSYIKAGDRYFKPADPALGLKWKEAGSDQPSGTEIKNEHLAAELRARKEKVLFKKEEWDEFKVQGISRDSYIKAGNRYFKPAPFWEAQGSTAFMRYFEMQKISKIAQDPIKYLVREMEPMAWPLQASSTTTSSPRTRDLTSLKPKERVLCICVHSELEQHSGLGECEIISTKHSGLGECEIISTKPGNSGAYRVKCLWHENNDCDINSKDAWINEQDIRYVLLKDGTCLHQDPLWRSALEIVVRSPLSSLFPSCS